MYATVRRYEGVTNPREAGKRVNEGFVPLISQSPGFVAYYWVDAGGGVMVSTSVFQDQAGAQELILRRNRFLDFYNHIGGPGLRRGGDDLCSSRGVFHIGERTTFPGAGLHQHPMTTPHQRLDRSRRQPHAVLVILDLFGQPDEHGEFLTNGKWLTVNGQ